MGYEFMYLAGKKKGNRDAIANFPDKKNRKRHFLRELLSLS